MEINIQPPSPITPSLIMMTEFSGQTCLCLRHRRPFNRLHFVCLEVHERSTICFEHPSVAALLDCLPVGLF
ncbi:hypothetical protein L204_104296 [Cryptococcus depauperatus]